MIIPLVVIGGGQVLTGHPSIAAFLLVLFGAATAIGMLIVRRL
jgi:hypothetical protein